MINYLEQAADEGTDALWDAVRRLDAALTVGAGQVGQETPQADAAGTDAATDHPTQDAAGSPSEELPLLAAVRDLEEAAHWLETAERVERGAEESGADPTWRAALIGGAERRAAGRSDAWSAAETAGSQPAVGWSGRGTDQGEIARQAQRLDQIFRRDSRRYDGGFFLY